MNLLPKTHTEFSQKEYWDSFFKKRTKAFEWYGEYPELSHNLHKYIKPQDNVLIVGCGNSTLGKDLYDIGYNNITNIDISQVVIRQMLSQNDKDRPNLKYLQMDALNTSFENDTFSVVLDKGTLDTLMPNNDNETVTKILQYFKEIERILKNGGRYICISLLQEHILNILVDFFPQNNWMFRIVRCFEAENKAVENDENSMPVFIVICTKFKSLPTKILEINLGHTDKMQRLENEDDILKHVTGVQHAAFVCSNLKKVSIVDDDVSFDLFEPGCLNPRFTVYVVDLPVDVKNEQYAAFIVPEGREAEWIFSTKAGRKQLVQMTKHNRLSIVTLHRDQKYDSLESVQNELSEIICNLAPLTLKNKKIQFLSLGSDVGKRQIKHKGKSEFSGDYVIEDVETDGNEKYRRLFYLKNQLVIQSEAKLKTIKSRKGISKEIIDLLYLTCNHHVYMSVAAHAACQENLLNSRIAVVGLGGGGLCSFLHKLLPKTNILGIDIDGDMLKIAVDWFGFQQNEKLRVQIEDGLEFLKRSAEKGETLDAVLFDVDSKDTSIGMSCPPKAFLEATTLENLVKILRNGFFILNIVIRDQSLRPTIINDLKNKFKTVICYKLDEDLNEIIICTNSAKNSEDYKNILKNSCNEINNFYKKHNCKDNNVDAKQFIDNLEINNER